MIERTLRQIKTHTQKLHRTLFITARQISIMRIFGIFALYRRQKDAVKGEQKKYTYLNAVAIFWVGGWLGVIG